ncbi:hypothetical protein VTN00DRAFT_8393 [Thermoascus crustaceus]|uniref:uncharacterized protein n=1 Tax=Thermoascus crustaceus TaxID=5088 RepID=UPI0037442EEC
MDTPSEISFDDVAPDVNGESDVDAVADHASTALTLQDFEELAEDTPEEDTPGKSAPSRLDEYSLKKDVDPKGDVILRAKKKDLLVSSKLLSMASPVFEKMFSETTNKDKRHEVSWSSLPTVTLEDDHPQAISLLCHILHYRRDVIRAVVDLDLLVKFMQLSEKYDCIPVVRAQGIQWLRYRWKILEEEEYPDGKDLCRTLLVAQYLNDRELLQAITAKIVGSLNMSDFLNEVIWTGLEDEELPAFLKSRLFGLRCSAFDDFLAAIERAVDNLRRQVHFTHNEGKMCTICGDRKPSCVRFCSKCNNCSLKPFACTNESRLGELIRILSQGNIWPLSRLQGGRLLDIPGRFTKGLSEARSKKLMHSCQGWDNCPLQVELSKLRLSLERIAEKWPEHSAYAGTRWWWC